VTVSTLERNNDCIYLDYTMIDPYNHFIHSFCSLTTGPQTISK